jgi:OmpA-OmpF porin, OOP family
MRLSKPVFWLLTVLWFAAGTWWYGSCSKCAVCAQPDLTQKIALPGFSVSDSNWNLSTADNLRFGKSGNTPVLGVAMTNLLDSVAGYTKLYPNKIITITGHYEAGEKNGTAFENLGLARADEIKKWLVSKGVAEKNILTKSQLEDGLVFSPADTLVGGITMLFNNTGAPTTTIPVKEDLFQPRTVYFNTGKNTLPVDTAFTNYIENVKMYLQSHADKKLLVTGYTDNVGDAEKNIQLSAGRAAFVKNALVTKGIAANKMESSGKGMNDPVADNNTADGRAKNRRVTIQLQ